MRLQVSALSETPLTPSVAHVFREAQKARHTLALNGITATAEMKRLKEKQKRRKALHGETTLVGS